MEKQRLFVDMDGTLAEWRNIKFSADIKKPEDIEKAINKLNKILLTPGYFESLLPHENVVEAVEKLSERFDIYILTCAMNPEDPNGPVAEKRRWRTKHMPGIDDDHMIIVPNGENKVGYIPGGIKEGDILLDDYTKNLKEWEAAGGWGVKLLNDINESSGTWVGSGVSSQKKPDEIADALSKIGDGERIRHESPRKNREAYFEITKDFVVPESDIER